MPWPRRLEHHLQKFCALFVPVHHRVLHFDCRHLVHDLGEHQSLPEETVGIGTWPRSWITSAWQQRGSDSVHKLRIDSRRRSRASQWKSSSFATKRSVWPLQEHAWRPRGSIQEQLVRVCWLPCRQSRAFQWDLKVFCLRFGFDMKIEQVEWSWWFWRLCSSFCFTLQWMNRKNLA